MSAKCVHDDDDDGEDDDGVQILHHRTVCKKCESLSYKLGAYNKKLREIVAP